MRRIAVIDMGSNSWRLVVYAYRPGGWWALDDEIREAVRVGEGMGTDSVLRPGPIDRALHTASVFAGFCRAAHVDEVIAVATSAIRDARNGAELLEEIRARTGLAVRVLTGEEEARYGYLAIANSTTVRDGFGLDVGGGSIQLMRLQSRRLAASVSLRLGAVRTTEAFLPGAEATPKQLKALRKHAAAELGQVDWLAGGDGRRRLAGTGGTVRNLAVAAQRRAGDPDTGSQGYVVTREALADLVEELAGRPAAKRGALPGIKPDRGDVILAGAVVVASVLEAGGFESVEVTDATLREGLFFERFLGDREPPLFDDVRRRSVENLSARFDDDTAHLAHVARLSLELYDGLVEAGLVEPDPEDRDVLWAACLLHDIGAAIGYDDHHKHSRYLVTNAGLPGWSPRELLLVALLVHYHRKGEPDVSVLGSYARKGDSRRVSLLAGLLRLAEQLERSRDQSVRQVRVAESNGRVTLEAGGTGDIAVALWAAGRSADLLGRALKREVAVAGIPDSVARI